MGAKRSAERGLGKHKEKGGGSDRCVCFIRLHPTGSPPGQLILPESLKLWPLLTLGALKSPALRENSAKLGPGGVGPDPRADERACALLELGGGRAGPLVVHRFTQPRLFDVACLDPTSAEGEACDPGASDPSSGSGHTARVCPGEPVPGSPGRTALPPPLVCSAASLGADKVLLVDAGRELFLWLGRDVHPLVLQELFGVDHVSDAHPPAELRRAGSSANSDGAELLPKLKRVVAELRRGLPTFAPLRVVASGPRAVDEPRVHSLLVEDQTRHGASYVDYLCAVHRKIQLKMV